MSDNRHHRCPRSHGGKMNWPVRGNCVRIDKDLHYRWHCLVGNMTGEEIMSLLNNKLLDPRFKVTRLKHFPK